MIGSGGPGLSSTPFPQHDRNYWVDVVFAATASTAPTAPASVTASAVSTSQVDLSWSGVADATGYRVTRSTDGAVWTSVATTAGGVTSHSDTGLAAGRPTTTGWRPPSPVATATTQSDKDLIPPSAPTGLTAAGAKKKIDLTWSASTDTGSSGLAGYTVWRGTGGASGSFTAIATSQSSSYSDTTVANKVTYWYRVTALDGGGNQSQPSNVVAAKPK